MRKLGIYDVSAMVKYAIKIGIIDPEVSANQVIRFLLYPLPKRLSNTAILCNMYGGQSALP
jgi:hypothetical protein